MSIRSYPVIGLVAEPTESCDFKLVFIDGTLWYTRLLYYIKNPTFKSILEDTCDDMVIISASEKLKDSSFYDWLLEEEVNNRQHIETVRSSCDINIDPENNRNETVNEVIANEVGNKVKFSCSDCFATSQCYGIVFILKHISENYLYIADKYHWDMAEGGGYTETDGGNY